MKPFSVRTLAVRALGILAFSLTNASAIKIRIDYRFDNSNFFGAGHPDGPAQGFAARHALERAADYLENIITDDLDSIKPKGSNRWEAQVTNPSGSGKVRVKNLKVSGDTILIFAGAKNLGPGIAGRGGPGGFRGLSGSDDWRDRVRNRGQGEATGKKADEVAPWGGMVTFQRQGGGYWHNDLLTQPQSPARADMYSVALHEIGHVLGIGTADSWDNQIKNGKFHGKASKKLFGGPVPLLGDRSHWGHNTLSHAAGTGFIVSTRMDHDHISGAPREVFTALDLAGLKDIGWKVRTRVDPRALPLPPEISTPITNQIGLPPPPFAAIVPSEGGNSFFLRNDDAIDSAIFSGIPFALAQHGQVQEANRVATRNLNHRLTRLRAGLRQPDENSPIHQRAAISSATRLKFRDFLFRTEPLALKTPVVSPNAPEIRFREPENEFFAEWNFGSADQDPLGELRDGLETETEVGSVGFERRLRDDLAVGIAWSHLNHEIRPGGGNLDLEGDSISAYATWTRGNLWVDILGSWTEAEIASSRQTFSGVARGDADTSGFTADLNLGWNLRAGDWVHGPIAEVRYGDGTVEPWRESGASYSNLSYAETNYDSLETQLGWQISRSLKLAQRNAYVSAFAAWEKEHLNSEEDVEVSLLESPYGILDASGFETVGGFQTVASTSRPGTDSLALGIGFVVEIRPNMDLSLDYETRVFRDSITIHSGGIRASIRF